MEIELFWLPRKAGKEGHEKTIRTRGREKTKKMKKKKSGKKKRKKRQ
jgi:hypothetical protein